jgi:hypothetical protein
LSLTEKPRCGIELASFNREDDNELRMLNVGADNFAAFLQEPYKKFSPLESSPGDFTVQNVAANELFVAGASPVRAKITEGRAVRVSSTGILPTGLDVSRIYYVKNVEEDESPGSAQGVFFKLAASPNGAVIQIGSPGSGKISAFDPNEQEDPLDGAYGTLSLAVPTVSTSSADSPFNTADTLRSSGAETIMGIGVDVAKIASEFLKPLPPLSDSGSLGPVGWDYTLASVELGPAVRLQTDFEMSWDLEVTRMTFSGPGVKINGQGSNVNSFTPAPGTVHLTNCGPQALPMIQLTDKTLVNVEITYVLKPKLQTVVAVPIIGQLDYQFFGAGANIDYIGRLGFGPVVEDSHKFKLGDFTVYDGTPSPIESVGTGTISFPMQASGPPSFDWNPEQLSPPSRQWTQKSSNKTNWLEVTGNFTNSFPGENNTDSSHASIAKDKASESDPRLSTALLVDSLRVIDGNKLTIHRTASGFGSGNPELGVVGGLVENTGEIEVLSASVQSSLALSGPDGILCGTGDFHLRSDRSNDFVSKLKGPGGASFAFCNYNTIRGSGEAMKQYGVSSASLINNAGTFRSEESDISNFSSLSSSANTFINHGILEATRNSSLSISGDLLSNRAGSRISAIGEGARVFLDFDVSEHSGLIEIKDGGRMAVRPKSAARGTLQAGQSLLNNTGYVRVDGVNSFFNLLDMDIMGGCFIVEGGGTIQTFSSGFNGSMFQIGDHLAEVIDEGSGTLILDDGTYSHICLSNFGTVNVPGDVELSDNVVFTNHGRVVVPAGARLRVGEVGSAAPGASPQAGFQPGTTNATASRLINRGQADETLVGGTLMGGSWEVSGELLIDGASFSAIGANSAPATTRSGSIDGSGGIINDAGEGGDRVISQGRAAEVVLHGSNWSFPAILGLRENRGSIILLDGASFPGSDAPGGVTPGDFTNKGKLELSANCAMEVGGSFIQCGPDPLTNLFGATLTSGLDNFQILGGSVLADSSSQLFNLGGGSITPGTSILVRSVLEESGNPDPFTGKPLASPDRVRIDLGGTAINTIPAGASIEIDGRVTRTPGNSGESGAGIHFPALTDHLSSNAGTLTLRGEGFNAPDLDFDNFVNTGQINVLGTRSEIGFGSYTQNGGAIRIASGCSAVFGSTLLNAGELVVEVSARSPFGWFDTGGGRLGAGFLRNPPADMNDKLVIDFTGDLAESTVDIGDTWEIAPRSTTIEGLDNVTFRLNGAAMPSDWLPTGAELTIVQFENPGTPELLNRGLAIRVAPIGGFIDYYTWAALQGLPDRLNSALADPHADGNGDGIPNELEFFYGLDGLELTSTSEIIRGSLVTGEGGGRHFELSFLRPSGVDASYTPYASIDLRTWTLASMLVVDIVPASFSGLEQVTLRSRTSATTDEMFFRVTSNFNPDNFEVGLLANTFENNYIVAGQGGLENFDGVLAELGRDIGYKVVPGRVLYFNVTGSKEGENSMFGGTAPDGTRNFIYFQSSPLQAAVVHAGLLNEGERGYVKVTFVEAQQTPFLPSEQRSEDGSTLITSNFRDPGSPETEPYSYKVEIHAFPDGSQLPNLFWSPSISSLPSGTPLGEAQLNATASTPGTFTYDPPLGTPAESGPDGNMILDVEFLPTDSLRYRTAVREIRINVTGF